MTDESQRTFDARGSGGRALCVVVLVMAVSGWTSTSAESGFLRIVDPGQPVHELDPIIERSCDRSRTVRLDQGSISLRFPSECEATIDPIVELLRAGFRSLAKLSEPIGVRIDSTLIIVDNRTLPPNITYESPSPNSQLVLAPLGCTDPDWWKLDSAWENLVRHFFHETAHVTPGSRFPAKMPIWLHEGSASYAAHRIDSELSERFLLRSIDSEVPIARFLATERTVIEKTFGRKSNFKRSVDAAPATLESYDLYLGSFLASDELDESLFRLLLESARSRETPKAQLRKAREIDASALHDRAQRLREGLVESARTRLRSGGDPVGAFATLGWLGVCDRASEVPRFSDCGDPVVELSPYYGRCLERQELEPLIRKLVSCGAHVRPGWGAIVGAYCHRFPDRAPEFVEPLSPDFPADARAHLERCGRAGRP